MEPADLALLRTQSLVLLPDLLLSDLLGLGALPVYRPRWR
jgi:hypothetical protein